MNQVITRKPPQIINQVVKSNGNFPNNTHYPFLIYKQTLHLENSSTAEVIYFLEQHQWKKAWIDVIYNFHHYHSNTHEVLIIFEGYGKIEIGGPNGYIYEIEKGDVVFNPAGVSHKSIELSDDFKCVGAYPFDIKYNMYYGNDDERPKVDEQIKKVPLPEEDPIFGSNGLLFNYWKEESLLTSE